MGEFKEKLDTLIAEQLPREKYNSNKQMWNVNVELGIKVNKFFMATELLGIVTFKPIHLSTPINKKHKFIYATDIL